MSWLSCIISNIVLALFLAMFAWFVQRWLRQYAVARILWLLVLVKLVTPPMVNLQLGVSAGTTACALGTCACGPHVQEQTILGTLPWVFLAIWLAGAGVTGWIAWRRWSQFGRLLEHATPAPLVWQALAARLTGELSLRRPPEILTVPGRLPPLVVPGWGRSRMLLPKALLGELNASQRVALLTHELMHIKRGDHLVRMLELIVVVAYWWLPIVASIGRQLRACEETCCDAAVVARLPGARRDYAQLLLDVLDFANPLPPEAVSQATAMSAGDELEQRLRSILHPAPGSRRARPVGAMALGLACAILPCGFQYDLAGAPAPVAASAEIKPAAGTPVPDGNLDIDLSIHCCPS